VSVFEDYREELEKHEFMMGPARGRLAVSLDRLTDALILIGQHGVYCTSSRNPAVPAFAGRAQRAQGRERAGAVGDGRARRSQVEIETFRRYSAVTGT